MGISAEIKSVHNNLTSAEQAIADYVLHNREKAARMSIYQLAEIMHISVPTVSRFTKKIGYSGFRDFKIDLVSEVAVTSEHMIDRSGDSKSLLVDKVFFENTRDLQETRSLLDTNDFIAFCEKLFKARRIIFFGLGASNLVAQYAAMRFSLIDFQAESHVDPLMMLLNAKRLDNKCVAVGISHSGESETTVKSIEIAKLNGAVTAGISNYKNSTLSFFCDHLFCTSYAENKISVVTSFSHVPQIVLIDAMFLLLSKRGKRGWNSKEIDEIIAEMIMVQRLN